MYTYLDVHSNARSWILTKLHRVRPSQVVSFSYFQTGRGARRGGRWGFEIPPALFPNTQGHGITRNSPDHPRLRLRHYEPRKRSTHPPTGRRQKKVHWTDYPRLRQGVARKLIRSPGFCARWRRLVLSLGEPLTAVAPSPWRSQVRFFSLRRVGAISHASAMRFCPRKSLRESHRAVLRIGSMDIDEICYTKSSECSF